MLNNKFWAFANWVVVGWNLNVIFSHILADNVSIRTVITAFLLPISIGVGWLCLKDYKEQ